MLFTVHISLLLVAKRALICRDLGEQDPAPGFDVAQEANPLNKCCRRIHKTVFSEHNRVSEAVRRLTSRTLLLLCSIISIWVPFTQALILFDVIIIWPRLNDTAQALASALPKVQRPGLGLVDPVIRSSLNLFTRAFVGFVKFCASLGRRYCNGKVRILLPLDVF